QCRQPTIHDDFRLERDKLSSVTFHHRRIPRGPSIVVDNVATLDPTEFLHPFAKRSHARLTFLILLRKVHEYANATAVTLLRARGERPRGCGSAEQSDELAPLHCSGSHASNRKIAHLGSAGGLLCCGISIRSCCLRA